MHCETPEDKNVFLDFGNDKKVLMQHTEHLGKWTLFPCGILAPEEERLSILLKAANHVLKKKNSKKLTVEVSEDLRKGILQKLRKPNGLRACSYYYILYWPMYKMESWDPKLKGNKMKKLRNISNRFYKKNKVRVKDSRDVPKEKLYKVVKRWLKKRNMADSVEEDYYFNLINSGFKGLESAKTIYVNGNPATITAGWKIPQSKDYYSAIGIVDYSVSGLGEIANIDDLNRLKRAKYEYADFGGSDRILLRFKRKFKPEKIYKTYTFSIVKKK